ncbi:DUF975 family protein [Listeria sp. PSOL-1]|uniref:DUF975 family protein n=1 Tax=Listeria sp. PSOL-1 TaxID=1844999 RepID=UPI0013CFE27D|nr:DUF975 family protein [Listeria sp. PSOL-1]
MMSITEVRRSARSALKGSWGSAIGVFLLSQVIIIAASNILGFIPLIGLIGSYLLIAPITVGVSWFYLAVSRHDQPDVGYMFSAFRDYGRTLLAYVLVTIFTLLWTLLFIIPGIIKAYSYSQTFLILRDNPNTSALDAITESRHLMNGHKGRFFLLSLTFLVWYLIPLIVGIIGFISFFSVFIASSIHHSINYSFTTNVASIGLLTAGGALLLLAFLLWIGISLYIYPYMFTSYSIFYNDLIGNTIYPQDELSSASEDPFSSDNHPEGFGPDEIK